MINNGWIKCYPDKLYTNLKLNQMATNNTNKDDKNYASSIDNYIKTIDLNLKNSARIISDSEKQIAIIKQRISLEKESIKLSKSMKQSAIKSFSEYSKLK